MATKTAVMERIHVISFMYSDGSGHKVIQSFKQGLKDMAEAQLDILQQNASSDGDYKLTEVLLFGEKEVG